jgi:SAM-dependent methyltransferase
MTSNYPKIFDEKLICERKKNISRNDFLLNEIENIAIEKILDIKREFGSVLDLRADSDFEIFAENKFDLVKSKLILHHTNDVVGYLKNIVRILQPDGFFMGIFFGGSTLFELRKSFSETQKNSISPHIYPMIDIKDAGQLLQKAGFALPVADSEKIEVSYKNAHELMKHLKKIGENNAIVKRRKSLMGKAQLKAVCDYYEQNFADNEGRITATFELITISGWKSDASQQKPLKPGSGKIPLNNIL